MSDTYHFTELREIRFYGGRWDGHTVTATSAPPVLLMAPCGMTVADPEQGFGCGTHGDLPAGWTRYERRGVWVTSQHTDIRYVDPLHWKEGA